MDARTRQGLISDTPLRTELDFLVACIKKIRQLREERKHKEAADFRKEMEEYFNLNFEMRDTHVYDELLRLSDVPAGMMKNHDPKDLEKLHDLYNGALMCVNGQQCTFVGHVVRFADDPRDGWFVYSDGANQRELTYIDAWRMLSNGELVLKGCA